MASGHETQSRSAVKRPSMSTGQATGRALVAQPFQSPSTLPCEPGSIIHGKYEVLRLIGTGGVGFVLAARHIGFDDLVALKFLRPEFSTNQEAVSRFMIEARASFKLRSEHVARVLDVDLFEGTPFLAMELLDGADLRSQLEMQRLLPIAPAVDYMLQACEALAAAHAIGVIHRDIKPENLFLLGHGEQAGHLKVLDFGISKVALVNTDRQTHQALTRVAVGTPPYMSPEQVRASSNLDARSDLWSLGCVLYELLTGTAPFDRISVMQSCAAVLEEDPVNARELRPAIPEDLSAVIMRCLRKDPSARFADVGELAEALSAFGSGRFDSYPARCRAHLNGEGIGRRSTPNSLAPVGPRISGAVPALDSSRLRSIGAQAQRQTHAQGAPLSQRSLHHVTVPPSAPRQTHAPLSQRSLHNVSVPPSAPAHQPIPEALEYDSLSDFDLGVPKRSPGRLVVWATPLVVGGLLAAYLGTREQPAPVVRPAPRVVSEAPALAAAAEMAVADPTGTQSLLSAVQPAAAPLEDGPAASAVQSDVAQATPEESAVKDVKEAKEASVPSTSAAPKPRAVPAAKAKPRTAALSAKPKAPARSSDEPDVGF